MVEAGVWLIVTAVLVIALLTVVSIRAMTDVLVGEEHEPEVRAPESEREDETAAVDGGQSGEA